MRIMRVAQVHSSQFASPDEVTEGLNWSYLRVQDNVLDKSEQSKKKGCLIRMKSSKRYSFKWLTVEDLVGIRVFRHNSPRYEL